MNETTTLTQTKGLTLSPEDRATWKADIAEGIDLLSEQEKLVLAMQYNKQADERSWSAMRQFFQRIFNQTGN